MPAMHPQRRGVDGMRAGFFYDHRFERDASGTYYSYGALPYQALARYLKHFDRVLVVGRVQESSGSTQTVASGEGIEWACLERSSRLALFFGLGVTRHVRDVMARVDCVIVRMPSLIGPIVCREAIRTRKPWMVEVVGCAWDTLWNHGSLQGKAVALPVHLRNKHYIEKAPFALYVSQQALQHHYPCRGECLGCSNVIVDTPRREVLERRLARLDSGLDGQPPTLGLVGSLDVNYKGHETALRAIALLKGSVPTLRLRCLGGGDPSRWAGRAAALRVAGQIEFSGALPSGAPVLEWMDRLDLFLIPSLTEGLPRALIEAMTRALPAVGARAGGIPELLGKGCVHPPGDHRHLARLIKHFLERPDEMKVHAHRNWETACDYAADILEERRHRFLDKFKAFAAASSKESQARASRHEQVLHEPDLPR
jgi:glycosyltransferase involved in cell wall biosynthesis